MPEPTAWAPPHELQVTSVTRPVGSPPLKILVGLTCPKPCPCANTPASRPSTGTAVLGVAGACDATGVAGAAGVAVAAADAATVAVAAGVAVCPGLAAGDRPAEHPVRAAAP